MAKTDITPEGMEAQIQQEAPKAATQPAAKKIDSKIPEGPLAEKWTNYKSHQKLVNPANKRLSLIHISEPTRPY